MTQIVWTVLPNGGDSQVLKVSLFLTLRMDGPPPNVPGFVSGAAAGLSLEFADASNATTATLPLTVNTSLLDANLWNSVFPSGSTVVPWVKKTMGSRAVISYPVLDIRKDVEALYKDMAENYGVVPWGTRVTDSHSLLQQFIGLRGQELVNFETPAPGGGGISIAFANPTSPPATPVGKPSVADLKNTSAFYQASRFYRRDQNAEPGSPPKTAFAPTQLDAHQAMAALGDHPQLLRRFGLVLDATVQRPASLTGAKVRVAGSGAGSVAPYTFFSLSGNVFVPAPVSAASDLADGMLKLGDSSRYEIQQMDVDSAALKLGDFAANQFGANTNTALAAKEVKPSTDVPTLQTTGIVVARNGRGAILNDRLKGNDTMTPETDGVYAEDVTRGYRVDVMRVSDGVWRSLSARHGAYLVGAAKQRVPASGEFHDEGYVKQTSATSTDVASDTKNLYLHEALFGWDGWSHVVRAPGRAIQFVQSSTDPDGTVHGAEQVAQIENTADHGEFKVEPQFKVEPGTLPKLRFGETYRLRARAVDLAGNSLPLSTSTPSAALSAPVTFRRHEPVPPPPLVLRRPLVEGESVEHVVIRTKTGPAQGVSPGVFFPFNDRHVAPPSGSFEVAIRHGKIDSFSGTILAYNYGLKSEGTLYDTSIYDTVLGVKTPVLGMQIVNTPEAAGQPTVPPTKRGDGLKTGQYVVHTEPVLRLPWLPDPLAAGFAINDGRPTAMQTAAVGSHTFNYIGGWPDLIPPKLTVLSTGAQTPSVSVDLLNGINVSLPPGTILPLTLSSTLTSDALGKLAIWDLVDPAKKSTLSAPTLAGQHWMFTPRRLIVAVNAVERPLAAAQFTSLTVDPRSPGQTYVTLTGVMTAHFHSTGQLDIEASWVDRVDRLSDAGPSDEPHAGHVFTTHPGYDDTTSVVPLPPVDASPAPEQNTPKHDFGDTRHRIVQYRPDATTRFREYFPPSVTSVPANITYPGVNFQVSIPATERPKPPEVLYVVPTFKWQTTTDTGLLSPTNTTSKRVGRGLRVYLSRPWFSSGVGEQLALVIKGNTAVTENNSRYISEWGADPAWKTSTVPTRELASTDFTNATVVTGPGLKLSEDTSVQVQAVVYDVQYSTDRKAWFVDIEFADQSLYFPFVRLALARYQASSLTDLELSPVVKAEFAQLVNDRTATLQFVGPLNQAIKVSVRGVAARNHLGEAMTSLSASGPNPTPPSGYAYNRNAGIGRVVTAQIEYQYLGASEVEWTPVGSPTVLPSFVATTNPGTEVLWYGSVPAPGRPLNVIARRLVIREMEIYDTDTKTADATLPITLPSGVTAARGRVVYLDVLPISDLDFI